VIAQDGGESAGVGVVFDVGPVPIVELEGGVFAVFLDAVACEFGGVHGWVGS